MTKRDKLLRAAIALCLVAAAPPTKAGAGDKGAAWQLFVWLKNGEKTGYLFADKPEFRLEGDMVKFQTVGEAMDIVKSDLDKFTVEQVLPTDPVGIALPETFLLGLKRSAQLNCTLQPADALTTLTWFNSNPAVASIGNGGLVTGLQPGETTLKVQTSNGLRAACLVTVPVPRYRLVVWKTNGRHDAYPFADKPEITIEGDIFTVASERATMGYRAADIEKFTLEDAAVTPEDFSYADANGDGVVDVADIAFIITVMAQGDKIVEQVIAADVNGDGVVDVADIATVISAMAGK